MRELSGHLLLSFPIPSALIFSYFVCFYCCLLFVMYLIYFSFSAQARLQISDKQEGFCVGDSLQAEEVERFSHPRHSPRVLWWS